MLNQQLTNLGIKKITFFSSNWVPPPISVSPVILQSILFTRNKAMTSPTPERRKRWHQPSIKLQQIWNRANANSEYQLKCITRPLHSSNIKETGTQAAKRLTHLSDRSRERLLSSEHWRLVIWLDSGVDSRSVRPLTVESMLPYRLGSK